MRIVEIPDSDRPECPNSFYPIHPSHILHVRLSDAAYNAIPTDPESTEMIDPAQEAVYNAITRGAVTSSMYLYTTGVTIYTPTFMRVESWFFKCPICGLILPTNKEQR